MFDLGIAPTAVRIGCADPNLYKFKTERAAYISRMDFYV
jgi:hypothetical protein